MMNIDALEAAILNKDPDGVVAALSGWDERQREAAREPFNILMMALGFDRNVLQSSDLKRNHRDVVAKRKRDGIVEMSRKDRTYDYEMSYIAWLGGFGLAGLEECKRFRGVHKHLPESAQILADRRPPWWDQWYDAVTSGDNVIQPDFWALLYQRGLASADSFRRMALGFAQGLPAAMESAPQAVQKVMLEIEDCRNVVYDAPRDTYQLFHASGWTPVIEWLRSQKLLDASRLLETVLASLHEPFNQTERNGCVIFAKAVKASGKTLAQQQARWAGLVADNQSSVAGYAVQQLAKIQKAGLLNAEEAIAALPNIFGHKPKTHAKTAVEMLGRIAADESFRCQAVEAVTTALMHPNKDVQKAALGVLSEHLRPDDDAAIDSIRLHRSSVAATLASDVEKLLGSAEDTSGKEPATALAAEGAAPGTWDIDRFRRLSASVPQEIRRRLRLDEALQAAGEVKTDLATSWTIQNARILASAEPIRPIETVEELVDVVTAAVEKCECPDTVDRIISGIARLYRQRPKSFDAMTRSLRKRGCAGMLDRPQRGIVAGLLGSPFVLLIGAWLGVEPDEDDVGFLSGPVQDYLAELSNRVRAGTATALLSEATHAGGWIDPRVWVRRLLQTQADGVELFEGDLVRSLLRLTPDGRDEALELCGELTSPLLAMATAALGGEVKIDASWTPQVWITALRARDPWIDLSEHLDLEEQAVLSDKMTKLPDVVYPADYQWSVRERTDNTSWRELIAAWPTQEDRELAEAAGDSFMVRLIAAAEANSASEDVLALLMGAMGNDDDALSQIADAESQAMGGEFLTAALHHLPSGWAPPYLYPYWATQWPMKLDWYWCLATKGLSKRVEAGSSVDEPYGRFLFPLLEIDRPLTQMAARALWIATISKDGNSRSMAVEVWIALVETDRTDVETLVAALEEIAEGGWVKLNRLSEVLAEVAAVSPLHAWAVAELLEAFLVRCLPFPRGVVSLLELLDESCERLGRAVSEHLRQPLENIKSGKAKTAAKSLLNRADQVTSDREAAVTAALEARLARSRRLSDGVPDA